MRPPIYGGYRLPNPTLNADEYARWKHKDLESMDLDQLRYELTEVRKALSETKGGKRLRREQGPNANAPGPATTAYIAIAGQNVQNAQAWLTERREALEACIQGVPPWQPGNA